MFLFVAHENKGKGKEINFLKELDLCNFAADLLLRKKKKYISQLICYRFEISEFQYKQIMFLLSLDWINA